MTLREKVDFLIRTLDTLYPDPQIPLRYSDPFTFLVAVMLSAQTTDKRVNEVTPALFAAASAPEQMASLPVERIVSLIHPVGLAPTKGRNLQAMSRILVERYGGEVPRTFEEAAAIDGCPPMKTFWKIMLPLAQPGIVTVGIFNFMNIWNEYFLSLIFASSEKNMSVGPGLKSVLTAMQYTGDWGGLFAAVVIVFLPTLVLFLSLSKTIISGITAGGVKG